MVEPTEETTAVLEPEAPAAEPETTAEPPTPEEEFAEQAMPKVVLAAHGDRLIVLRDAPRSQAGGLELPQNAREQALSGTVFAVGDLVRRAWQPWWKRAAYYVAGKRAPAIIRAGMRVRLGTHAGYPLPEEDHPNLLILREDEIMALERIYLDTAAPRQ